MNPFDPKAMAEYWAAGTQAFLKAQGQAGQALADGWQAMATGTLPVMPGFPTDLTAVGADLSRASQAMTEMWSAAGGLFASLSQRLPLGGGTTPADTALANILHPSRWMAGTGEMDDVLGRMAEGPRLADLWDAERRYSRVLRAWVDLRRRGLEHNAVVLDAWMKAGRRFSEELAGRTATDARAPDAKAALALWTEVANKQLLETQRSDAFLNTQTAMIRASTELRLAQQDLVEHFGKQYGFPTRTELDDVHRTVTELRREMRALRRTLRDRPPAPAIEAPPAPAPKPARAGAVARKG